MFTKANQLFTLEAQYAPPLEGLKGAGRGDFYKYVFDLTGKPKLVMKWLHQLAVFNGIVAGSAAMSVFYAEALDIPPFVGNDVDFFVPTNSEGYSQYVIYTFEKIFEVYCFYIFIFI